jgi:RimJ/RimL family protein N-acetyltransferase
MEVEIGYSIVNDMQGKGYGYEALSLLISWIRISGIVKVVKATCRTTNIASIRLLEKTKFTLQSIESDLMYFTLFI